MGTLRLAPGLEWRPVEGEIVVLDLQRGLYFALNPTGAAVWGALAEGTTEDAMVETLEAAFAVDTATASADLGAFLEDLRAQGLLVEG